MDPITFGLVFLSGYVANPIANWAGRKLAWSPERRMTRADYLAEDATLVREEQHTNFIAHLEKRIEREKRDIKVASARRAVKLEMRLKVDQKILKHALSDGPHKTYDEALAQAKATEEKKAAAQPA